MSAHSSYTFGSLLVRDEALALLSFFWRGLESPEPALNGSRKLVGVLGADLGESELDTDVIETDDVSCACETSMFT